MSLVFNWAQSNGTANTVTDLGSSGNLADFKANDTTGISDYSANPVVASDVAGQGYSMEVWLRLHISGTGNSAFNFKFWRTIGFDGSTNNLVTGINDYWGLATSYGTPASTASSKATATLSLITPGTQNVSVGGSANGSMTSFPAFSDYIVLQTHVGAAAPQGDTGTAVYAISYDET